MTAGEKSLLEPRCTIETTTKNIPISIHCQSLPDFPEDVFILVLEGLEAWDVIRCQMVSRAWQRAFSKEEYLQISLKNYPDAIEIRSLNNQFVETKPVEPAWSDIFSSVASRYYHLRHGKAHKIERHKLAASEQIGQYFSVGLWDYHESQPGGRLYYENATHLTHSSRPGSKPYLFRSSMWTYDDGLLVFAPAEPPLLEKPGYILVLLDLVTNATTVVPFDVFGKIIRNIRLCDHTLVIEWAERDPFHDLNEMEQVNRHFASCFDVYPTDVSLNKVWKIRSRSEWKIHFLGLPLNNRDRFFSTHNSKHYAVYFWQPNRSMYTGDEELPIESLSVWSISSSSKYRPSADPSGNSPLRPNDPSLGPHIVSRIPFAELDYLGIRQHSNISLMSLHLDSEASTLTVRENVCVSGQGYFDPAERLWNARTTSFLFEGSGPHLRREWDGDLPPYRGHCSMESTDVEESEKWFLPIMDVVDEAAKVRLSLVETCFTGQMMDNRIVLRVKALGEWSTMNDEVTNEVAGMGRIAGNERWVVGQNERMELVVVRF